MILTEALVWKAGDGIGMSPHTSLSCHMSLVNFVQFFLVCNAPPRGEACLSHLSQLVHSFREKMSVLKCHLSWRMKEICEAPEARTMNGLTVPCAVPALSSLRGENTTTYYIKLSRSGLARSIPIGCLGAGERAQRLGACPVFSEDKNLVPSTHSGWFTTAVAPTPEGH